MIVVHAVNEIVDSDTMIVRLKKQIRDLQKTTELNMVMLILMLYHRHLLSHQVSELEAKNTQMSLETR